MHRFLKNLLFFYMIPIWRFTVKTVGEIPIWPGQYCAVTSKWSTYYLYI